MKKHPIFCKTLAMFLFAFICLGLKGQTYDFSLSVNSQGTSDGPIQIVGNQQFCSFPKGHPNIRAISVLVMVPNGNKLLISPVVGERSHWKSGYIKAVPPKVKENSKESLPPESNYKVPSAYSLSQYPGKFFDIQYIGKYRGQELAIIYLYPYQYADNLNQPDESVTYVYKTLHLEIKYDGKTIPFPINLRDEYDPTGDRPVIRPLLVATANYDQVIAKELVATSGQVIKNATTTTIPGYEFLIITHTSLLEAANRLKDYKISRGIETKVKVFNGTVTPLAIEKYIYDTCYTLMNPIPLYILLMGDVNLIPASNKFDGVLTDQPYFDTDGVSFNLPDFSSGRMPVNSITDANNWIDKIIKYEKTTHSNSVFSGVSLVSFFEPSQVNGSTENLRYIKTCQEANGFLFENDLNVDRLYYSDNFINNFPINTYTNKAEFLINGETGGGPMPGDIQLPQLNSPPVNNPVSWNNGPAAVSSTFSHSKFLILHRGHGSVSSWGTESFTQFSSDNVSSLNNSTIQPVVWSINCSTGKFNEPTDCISEKLVKKVNGGAVAVLAATGETNTRFNDHLVQGLMQSVWLGYSNYIHNESYVLDYGSLRMGDITMNGLFHTLGIERIVGENPSGDAQNQTLAYTLLGDPTLELLPYHRCVPLRTFNNLSFVSTVPLLYDGAEKIVVSGSTIINSGANADFRASQSIRFTTGFKVNPGGLFHAVLEPCYVSPDQPSGIIRQNVAMKTGEQETETENQISVTNSIEVFPNPTSGFITIKALGEPQNSLVEIYNQLGSLVYKGKIVDETSNIDLLPFGKGLYIVSIREESKMRQFKIVVY